MLPGRLSEPLLDYQNLYTFLRQRDNLSEKRER